MNNIISFPHLGEYYLPVKYLVEKATNCQVIIPPKNTKETIKIGSKYSPDDICMPFKYNLGNYIEALNQGATILIQAGGGCRYGYYAELQEKILRNIGYKFEFINLIQNNHVSIKKLYKFSTQINKKINIFKFIYYLLVAILTIMVMDKLSKYIRKNIGFEKIPRTFERIEKAFYYQLENNKLNIKKIIKLYRLYKKKYYQVELNDKERRKILIIGELYSLIDQESSNHLEINIAKQGFEVIRYTNLTYLLITKKFMRQILLHKGRKYLKYTLGADGTESVVHTLDNCKKGIDGIIHIKSFGCTPEINAMPILNEISSEYKIPILFLSFDGENSVSNLDTKLEAFSDMIKSKKNKKKI